MSRNRENIDVKTVQRVMELIGGTRFEYPWKDEAIYNVVGLSEKSNRGRNYLDMEDIGVQVTHCFPYWSSAMRSEA